MRQNISIGFVLLLAVFILFGNCVHAETQSANETQKVPESKPWWWEYSTIASHPRQKSIEEIQGIDADCWRAAGWYAGWFGYFYSDYSIQDTPTLKGWDRVKEAGSKPMMFFDAGEIGDVIMLFDENNNIINEWKGEECTARWFGFEAFMENAPWSKYPTAEDYGLKPFTMPNGDPIEKGKLYDVLASRWIQNERKWDNYSDKSITDETAESIGLTKLTEHQVGGKDVRGKTGWITWRITPSVDHTNLQLSDYWAAEIDLCIERYRPAGIHIDNLGDMNLFCPTVGSFGIWTSHTYREYLKRNFTPEQLVDMGVDDIETFELRDYVLKGYEGDTPWGGPHLTDPKWLDDILWKCHFINKVEMGMEFHKRIYNAAKEAARRENVDSAIFGNAIPMFPGNDLIKGLCDIYHFEWMSEGAYPDMPELGLPPKARTSYVSRLGAEMSIAPYCWPSIYVPKHLTGPDHQNMHKVQAFDCLANRGIMDYGQWYLGNYSPGTDESAGFVNRFINANSALISGREYLADVALAYSSWTNIAASNGQELVSELFLDEFKGWTDYLGNSHNQWDVVLSQEFDADVLSKYPILVLPSIMVITDAEAAELEKYVELGGRIVATGLSGTRLGKEGYLQRRETNALESLKNNPNVKITSFKPGVKYFTEDWNAHAAKQMADLLIFDGLEPNLTTDAPVSVGVNISIGGAEESLITLDLNNFNLDLESDTITPAPVCKVTFKLPENLVSKDLKITYVYPEMENLDEQLEFPSDSINHDKENGTVTLTMPSFKYYLLVYIK